MIEQASADPKVVKVWIDQNQQPQLDFDKNTYISWYSIVGILEAALMKAKEQQNFAIMATMQQQAQEAELRRQILRN